MTKKAIALLAALGLMTLALAGPASAQGVQQIKRTDYENAPFMVSVPTIPQVLLILSKNIQMFQQAYPGLVDMDGDGIVDTGFNPAVVYTGYFDPYSCYGYQAGYTRKWSTSNKAWSIGDPAGLFVRVGPSQADIVDSSGQVLRPTTPDGGKILKDFVKSPVSATGICTGVTYQISYNGEDRNYNNYTDNGRYNTSSTFSGNWLNYLTTSRMDAIRKILYGGTRVQPEPQGAAPVRLEASFVPHDSTAWGTEVMADDIWSEITPRSVYYDITKYTPFPKPNPGQAHFFSRTRDRGAPFQAFRMLPNAYVNTIAKPSASSQTFAVGSTDSVGERVENVKGRYWDWALGNRPVPDDQVLQEKYRRSIRVYRLVVEACTRVDGNISATEGCMQYPDGSYKPVGLLQKYGQGGLMNFGLMTGSYNSNIRHRGGVIRNHIGDISNAVDPYTGKIINNGLISNMDRLMVSGRYITTLEGWPAGGSYYDTNSWGNPVGEMLFEGVRYFASLTKATPLSPTSDYTSQSDNDASSNQSTSITVNGSRVSPINQLTRERTWNWNGRNTLRAADCAKPVILLISDINGDHDGDNAVNSGNNDLRQPTLSGLKASDLPAQFSMSTYLQRITNQEGLSGGKFFYSTSTTGDCSARSLTSLADVKGLCPGGPAFGGTYSAAAVAYYAHTHNFSASTNEAPIDIYAVTMSSAFPELTFKNGTDGDRQISIMPVNMSANHSGQILSFLNYYILEWHTGSDGQPFSATIQVNFSDKAEGDDWEMDVIVTYKIDLLTNASGPDTIRLFKTSDTPVSGILKKAPHIDYYGFKNNYNSASESEWAITVNPGRVAGLSVDSKIEKRGTGVSMGLGYTISGSNSDGTYLDLGLNSNVASTYQTPPNCQYKGGANCGKIHTTQRQIRTFEFVNSGTAGRFLDNPLFLAAKYGGFKDPNKTGVPVEKDKGEGDHRWANRKIGVPDNYFQATNISELSEQLGAAFQAIARSVSTGTATASSVNSILGGGVSIQTLFYPEYKHPQETDRAPIKWVGNIYGLFIDKFGNLREDTNGNRQLDVVTGDDGDLNQGDMVVQFTSQGRGTPKLTLRRDIKGDNNLIDAEASYNLPGGAELKLEDLKTLWNTSWQLADLSDTQAAEGRSSYSGANAGSGRYIMSYFGPLPADPENDGWDQGPMSLHNYLFTVDNSPSPPDGSPRLADLMLSNSALSLPAAFAGPGGRSMYIRTDGQLPTNVGEVEVAIVSGGSNDITTSLSGHTLTVTIRRHSGSGTAAALVELINGNDDLYLGAPIIKASLDPDDDGDWVVNTATKTVSRDRAETASALIEYVRGQEKPGWRSRTVRSPWSKAEKRIVWRLGDIINSKPVIVGAPNSNFDFIYRDTSYAAYKLAQGRRRQVAYFGSNDGMLHAINLGFFGSLENGAAGYTTNSQVQGLPIEPTEHPLGAELWAYVPPSVLPHLQWLVDPEYAHSYYVDLKPHIVDIKNTGDAKYLPGEKGTVTWGPNEWRTVLIGGLRLGGRTIDTSPIQGEPQYSYSEFFALDVTDPEQPPILLWRFSSRELGLSTCQPAVVSSNGSWYVVLGSGPTSDMADNVDGGPILTDSKAAYDGKSNQRARLIVLDAVSGRRIRTIIAEEENSFFNDSFTPIVSKVRDKGHETAAWDNNVVYFGLTQSLDESTGQDRGAVYRLQMVDADTGEAFSNTSDWKLARLFKADKTVGRVYGSSPEVSRNYTSSRPVTGAVNAARDRRRNTWIVFGTGRMWSLDDAAPCQGISDENLYDNCLKNHEHYLYGLKEPMKQHEETKEWLMSFEEITDTENIVDVSSVKVYDNGHIANFGDLTTYTALQSRMFDSGTRGYRRKLATASITGDTGSFVGGAQEVCLYQPKIEGLANGQSLAAFTTYEPDLNICNPEGRSYLHVIDTFTGVPAPYMYEMGFLEGSTEVSKTPGATPGEQVTGYIDAGKGKSTEAWITSDLIGTTGQDGTPYTLKMPQAAGLTNAVISWREILDMGFTMDEDLRYEGIEGLDPDATPAP